MSLVCVNDFESLLKIHVYVVDVQLPLPFRTPFLDVAQSEDLVRSSSSFSKTCSPLFELLVHCLRDPLDDGFG